MKCVRQTPGEEHDPELHNPPTDCLRATVNKELCLAKSDPCIFFKCVRQTPGEEHDPESIKTPRDQSTSENRNIRDAHVMRNVPIQNYTYGDLSPFRHRYLLHDMAFSSLRFSGVQISCRGMKYFEQEFQLACEHALMRTCSD